MTKEKLVMATVTITTVGAPKDKIILIGDVYRHREHLKKHFDAYWNSNLRGWLIPHERASELDAWIVRIRPQRRCGLCNSKGHDRRNCDYECSFCQAVSDHLEENCTQKSVQTNPRWRRFQTGCYCTDRYICYRCRYDCCEEAQRVTCVCLYCFRCPQHNIERQCHGSHD